VATLNIRPASEADDADLQPYRTLRRRKDLERHNLFVVEGSNTVIRFLESDYPVVSLLITEEWLEKLTPLLDRRDDIIEVFTATKPQFEELTGFSTYQGVKALGRIHKLETLDSVLRSTSQPRLFVALDGISNSENLGVIIRNCAGFGVQAALVGDTSASPFLTRAIRTSMGAVFRMPTLDNLNLPASLRRIRQHGIRCLAAHPSARNVTLYNTNLTDDCCLVFGSEGEGISSEVLAECDDAIAIPTHGQLDSLNVSSAVAAFLCEAQRQRNKSQRPLP
jgi:tRNA G18 (ribose-2'-O)-methylase SpoU